MFDNVFRRLWLILSLLTLRLEAAMIEQRFAIEPQDQTAIVGNRVTLPCRVINKLGSLQWTKDDFALGTHRSLKEFVRYSMIGSDEEGDYSLAIEPVMLDDDAKYQCQVSSGLNGEPGIRSRYARLVVLVPPETPRIIQGSELDMTEDSNVKLECVSQNGKPAAEITWLDGQGVVMKKRPNQLVDIEHVVENSPESRLFTAKSILTIRAKKEHHNTTFTCQAQNTADRSSKSAKILLRVKYAPKVVVNVVPKTGSQVLIEGSDAKLVCQVDANPPPISYRWYFNQEWTFPDNPTELIIRNVSRRYHDSIVKCEAQNTVGKSEDSYTLEVTYGPRFRQKPQSVQADPNTTVQLICDVEGNPAPAITWTHGRDKIVSHSPNLTLVVNREKVGRYYCRAIVPGFPEIGSEAYVRMNGRPSIQKNSIQSGIVGETVRLECWAYSVPQPDKVRWSFGGQPIDPANPEYSILDDLLAEGIRSTLVIRNSRQSQYGTYSCVVSNPYGSDMVDIQLKAQKSFPVTVVLTVATGCGFTFIMIIMIALMCQRGKNRKTLRQMTEDKHIEKQCKESDKSSSISELKLDMRTGSSASNINCESDYGGGRDSDSITTRVAVPLAEPVPVDQQYAIPMNRYSSGDFRDPMFLTKTGQNNNGYVSFSDYSRSSTMTPTSGISPIVTSCAASSLTSAASLDLHYSAVYGNPYLRVGNHPAALSAPSEGQPLPPPPYTCMRNGSAVSTLARSKSSSPATSSLSQYLIPVSKTTQHIRTKEAGTTQQATHV